MVIVGTHHGCGDHDNDAMTKNESYDGNNDDNSEEENDDEKRSRV